MAKPGGNKTARAWLRVQGHKPGAKHMQANPLTDPGRYKTAVRESGSIIEPNGGTARASKVPKFSRMGKAPREKWGAARTEGSPGRPIGQGDMARRLEAYIRVCGDPNQRCRRSNRN